LLIALQEGDTVARVSGSQAWKMCLWPPAAMLGIAMLAVYVLIKMMKRVSILVIYVLLMDISLSSVYGADGLGSEPMMGLKAEYFQNEDLIGSFLQRIEETINLNYGHFPQHGNHSLNNSDSDSSDSFSVRWTGQVEPAFAEDCAASLSHHTY
jgi:hypothetical protein